MTVSCLTHWLTGWVDWLCKYLYSDTLIADWLTASCLTGWVDWQCDYLYSDRLIADWLTVSCLIGWLDWQCDYLYSDRLIADWLTVSCLTGWVTDSVTCLLQAVMYPAASALWGKWSPPLERSMLVGITLSGSWTFLAFFLKNWST